MNNSVNSKFALLVIFFCLACFILPSAPDAESSSSKTAPRQLTTETVKSAEVLLGPEVHWRAHAQAEDLFKTWNFDQEPIGGLPPGFSAGSNQTCNAI